MKLSVITNTSYRSSDGQYQVVFRLSERERRILINTGLRTIKPFQGVAFPKGEINSISKTVRLSSLYKKIDQWMVDNPIASFDEVADFIKRLVSPQTLHYNTLVNACEKYAETLVNKGTAAFYIRTSNILREFDHKASFNDVNHNWLLRLDLWMLGRGLNTNGRGVIMRCLRAVFNRAIDNGDTNNYPFRSFKIKTEKTIHRTLTLEQLSKLRSYPLHDDFREIYRDLFFLSFYLCGINARDLLEMPPTAYENGRICYSRKKTGHRFDLLVPIQAQEIIERYRGKDLLLSPLEQYANYYDFLHHWNAGLKKIGDIEIVPDKVGKLRKRIYHPIEPKLSTYYARHTWATIAAQIGISRDTIAQCLGHSWADVTAIYIAPDFEAQDKAIKAVADALISFEGGMMN